ILGRKRAKGRDFYDVSFMFGFTEPDFDYIFKVSGMKKEIFIDKLIKRCEDINFNEISKDVRVFLIFREQVSRIKNFKSFIKERMNKYLK
ncbi:nucleotidyl transferase AbiEii/AbiGii toxin family protein, partial [bacterium]|nr:nucleotidyl transferase AbiEii/AbiGii toxin family protein [bacterium]